MANPTEASAGVSDDQYLLRLREFCEDLPVFSPENLVANGQNTEYRVTDFPIYDGDPFFSVTVPGSGAQQLVPTRSALASPEQIAVEYETGWIFWSQASPPPNTGANTPITIRKSKVRWRDQKMMEALSAGLKMMFPKVWQRQTDTSITLGVNQWDYQLPVVFTDPRVTIFQVEAQVVPNATERFIPMPNWRRVGGRVLHVPYSQVYPPGTILRISYCGPYQSLGDLEDQLQFLPLLYAKGYLLSNKEIVRVRMDTANTGVNEQANPIGSSQNAGAFFLKEFDNRLAQLQRGRPMAPVVISYQK